MWENIYGISTAKPLENSTHLIEQQINMKYIPLNVYSAFCTTLHLPRNKQNK